MPIIEDAAEALGATYQGRPAGSFGRAAAFSFNGNKIITTSGGGMLVSTDKALDRPGALPRHPGPRSGAPLPAFDDRLQLPHEQPAGGGRPRPAPDAGRPGRATPRNQRARTSERSRERPGHQLHARGRLRPIQRLADLHSRSIRRRSAPTGRRSACTSRRRTSSRARSGSRCTCSRCLPDCRVVGGSVAGDLFDAGPVPAERHRHDGRGLSQNGRRGAVDATRN